MPTAISGFKTCARMSGVLVVLFLAGSLCWILSGCRRHQSECKPHVHYPIRGATPLCNTAAISQ
eukprot:scaffold2561_cov108-Isochrysis_galbana.AAC.5